MACGVSDSDDAVAETHHKAQKQMQAYVVALVSTLAYGVPRGIFHPGPRLLVTMA